MSFQVEIGSLGGTKLFQWDFVPLYELWPRYLFDPRVIDSQKNGSQCIKLTD